jgi:hypothetical protein
MNRVFLWALVVILSCSGLVQAGELQNGGFENELAGWTTSSYGNAYVEGTTGGTEGSSCAHLQAVDYVGMFDAEALLTQTFSAHGGDVLSFDVAGYYLGGDATCSAEITTAGWSHFFPTYEPGDFAPRSCTLPADGDYTLSFRAYAMAYPALPGDPPDSSISTLHIDNVRLTPVPEPSTLLLLGICGAAVVTAHVRRRLR